jgi:hypothetical protein
MVSPPQFGTAAPRTKGRVVQPKIYTDLLSFAEFLDEQMTSPPRSAGSTIGMSSSVSPSHGHLDPLAATTSSTVNITNADDDADDVITALGTSGSSNTAKSSRSPLLLGATLDATTRGESPGADLKRPGGSLLESWTVAPTRGEDLDKLFAATRGGRSDERERRGSKAGSKKGREFKGTGRSPLAGGKRAKQT